MATTTYNLSHPVVLKLRWIFFLPYFIAVIYIPMKIFYLSLLFFVTFSAFYFLTAFAIIGLLVTFLYRPISLFLESFVLNICPSRKTAVMTFCSLTLINNIWLIIQVLMKEENYASNLTDFKAVCIIIAIICITYFIFLTVIKGDKSEAEEAD